MEVNTEGVWIHLSVRRFTSKQLAGSRRRSRYDSSCHRFNQSSTFFCSFVPNMPESPWEVWNLIYRHRAAMVLQQRWLRHSLLSQSRSGFWF